MIPFRKQLHWRIIYGVHYEIQRQYLFFFFLELH